MHILESTPNFVSIWDVYTQVTTVYSDNLPQKLPGDEFSAEIWEITGTSFNWVRAHSQNFVLILGMRISFNSKVPKNSISFIKKYRCAFWWGWKTPIERSCDMKHHFDVIMSVALQAKLFGYFPFTIVLLNSQCIPMQLVLPGADRSSFLVFVQRQWG